FHLSGFFVQALNSECVSTESPEIEKVTSFVGQDRLDWISQQIGKYWKRKRRAAGLYLLAALESFSLIPIIVVLPFDVRPSYTITVFVLFLSTILGSCRLNHT